MEVIIWCTRHQFLENVQSRFSNSAIWSQHVQERKSVAVNRSWPEFSSNLADSARSSGFRLFIEQALSNLGIERSYLERSKEEVDIVFLQDENSPLLFHSKIDETNKYGCYPFKNLRAATDVLFLHGTSDMVVCKQAIVSLTYVICYAAVNCDTYIGACVLPSFFLNLLAVLILSV